MNYELIISRSFKIAWEFKWLWLFGLFADGGGQFNFQFGETQSQPAEMIDPDAVLRVLLPFLVPFLVFLAAYVVCHMIAVPALIDATNKIVRGDGTFSFESSYSRGVDFFWRIAGLSLLFFMIFVIFAAVSALIAVVTVGFGLILLIPAWIVLFPLMFHLLALAERSVVIRDSTIGDAVREAWELTMSRLGNNVIMFLIVLGIGLGLSICAGIILFVTFFPMNLIVTFLTESLQLKFVLSLIFGLPFTLVVGGYLGVVVNSLYTLFYFELVEPGTLSQQSKSSWQPPTPLTPPSPETSPLS